VKHSIATTRLAAIFTGSTSMPPRLRTGSAADEMRSLRGLRLDMRGSPRRTVGRYTRSHLRCRRDALPEMQSERPRQSAAAAGRHAYPVRREGVAALNDPPPAPETSESGRRDAHRERKVLSIIGQVLSDRTNRDRRPLRAGYPPAAASAAFLLHAARISRTHPNWL
jgi:hypothetical protein